MMKTSGEEYLLETIKSFRGMKSNAEKAIEQISDNALHFSPDPLSNSVGIIIQHVAGNLKSRFRDFLTTDGEKPDRHRDEEFIEKNLNRNELMALWNYGWNVLFTALNSLNEADLLHTVTIRKEPHSVIRALQRQLVHSSYHCGQIVYLCKMIAKENFHTLTVPRGESETYIPHPAGK